MKTFYYYMPPCPKCGSECTGRYVSPPYVNKHYTMLESLKNGELVRYIKNVPVKNAYCEECGFEWKESPRLLRLSPEEKEEEIARRKTERKAEEYMQKNKIDPNKKPFLGGLFSGLTNFF